MNDRLPRRLQHHLLLADGSRWVIAAGDEEAASVVSRLSDAMQLLEMSGMGAVEPPHHGTVRRLLVRVDTHNPEAPPAPFHVPLPRGDDGVMVRVLRSFPDGEGLFVQLMELSSVLARDAQTRGGVLLHGALAERDGIGVILAAPGGTGKTTASDRLPAPWRSVCDDTTLVVRDSQGNYWAHPWPTWSRFLGEQSGGTWDVQTAVPLRAVFFLSQAGEDRVEPVGPGHAVSLLVECTKQASHLMARDLRPEETRALHLERFNNLCDLARIVPAHVLHISLTGDFWQEIEQSVGGGSREGT